MAAAKRKRDTVAILGYGSQGRAVALNLRDSGYEVVIGLRSRSKSRPRARADKFDRIAPFADAVADASTIVVALPDHLHGRLLNDLLSKQLQPGSLLLFLHGLSVHFGQVTIPRACDVCLLAPHAPGPAVREKYLGDRSISAFYAVHQNASRNAAARVIRLAGDLGFASARLVKTTFEHEAIGDLFGEQAVLCGGLVELIQQGYRTLVERGIPPANAYLEVAYQLDLIVDLIKRHGIAGMYDRISLAARYGASIAGPEVINEHSRAAMSSLMDSITSGAFASRLAGLTDQEIADLRASLTIRIPAKFDTIVKKFSR